MSSGLTTLNPSHLPLLITNHLPRVPADDPALTARLLVIPLDPVVPGQGGPQPRRPAQCRTAHRAGRGRGGVARLPSSEPARPTCRGRRCNVDLPDQQRAHRRVHRRPLPAQPAQTPRLNQPVEIGGDRVPRELATVRHQPDAERSHGVTRGHPTLAQRLKVDGSVQQVQHFTIDLYDSLLRVMQECCTCCTEPRSESNLFWAVGRWSLAHRPGRAGDVRGRVEPTRSSLSRSTPSPAAHHVRPSASKAVTRWPGKEHYLELSTESPHPDARQVSCPHYLLGRGCLPVPMVYPDSGRRYGQGRQRRPELRWTVWQLVDDLDSRLPIRQHSGRGPGHGEAVEC